MRDQIEFETWQRIPYLVSCNRQHTADDKTALSQRSSARVGMNAFSHIAAM